VLLLIAVTLLDPTDIAPHFEAIRSTPTASKDTAAAMILTVLGAGTLAGLVPLHGWLVPAHAAAPPRGAAALSGGLVPVAIYLLLRIVVDLTGGTPPFWWGLPFLLMGAASAVLGGWRAATELRIDRVVAAATPRSAGLAAIGVGLMLFGRGADLPSLTALALAAVLLLSAGQSICATLMMLTSGAVQQSAGTNRLDRLGGLLHRMPMASIALASGVFGLAGLPPGIAFAGTWLLFQALLAAPRAGGLAPQILLAGLAAALALSAALAASAAVRLLGVACLGRPRTPRAAAAGDIPSRTRPPLLTLSVLGLLLGLLPGVVLWLLANPAILLLTGTSLGSRAGVLGLAPGAETPGYAALPLAALIALCGGATVWFIRRRSRPERSSPAWHDGFAPPPAWLPFGDPLDQTDGSGFVPELPAPPDRRRWPDWRPMTRVVAPQAAALWAVLVIIGALLAMLTILGPA
jgi:formate hydrogenlyase subunit 3/multisubunit Na+/H+ antiporter MnhD subunit